MDAQRATCPSQVATPRTRRPSTKTYLSTSSVRPLHRVSLHRFDLFPNSQGTPVTPNTPTTRSRSRSTAPSPTLNPCSSNRGRRRTPTTPKASPSAKTSILCRGIGSLARAWNGMGRISVCHSIGRYMLGAATTRRLRTCRLRSRPSVSLFFFLSFIQLCELHMIKDAY